MEYKSKDITRLTGISAATLRDWRGQGKDFEGVRGDVERLKDRTYSKRGLLSLAVMKVVRDSGGNLGEAWGVSFWAVGEIAKWLEIWDMDSWAGSDQGHIVKATTKARWMFFANTETPIVTDDASYLGHMSVMIGKSCKVSAYDLKQVAMNLDKDLIAAVGGRKNSNWV